MKTFFLSIMLLAFSFFGFAQLPKTEIWVFDLKQTPAGYSISNPQKITAGNEYNNQPWFTQDGQTMYFVSNKKNGGKTDIFLYDFTKKRRALKQVTKTKYDSEYSPQLTPGGDRISCVRVAKDTVTQNLCTYNLKGKKPEILLPQIKTFGYYAWKNQVSVLAFHVPEPFMLRQHDLARNTHDTLAKNIGRCIHNQRGQILYVDKTDTLNYKIKLLNNKKLNNRDYDMPLPDNTLTSTLPDQEDFALLKGKDLLMGQGGFVFRKKDIFNNPSAEWEPFLDMNHFKIYNFYRLAVSPLGNRIAVVAYAGDKP